MSKPGQQQVYGVICRRANVLFTLVLCFWCFFSCLVYVASFSGLCFFLLPLWYSLNVLMGLELLFIFKLTVFSTLQTILIQPIYTTQCKLIFVD